MRRNLLLTFALLALLAVAPAAHAQVRLVGITGNLGVEISPGVFGPDETLYEINLTNASTTKLFQTTHIPDTDSIGYNPVNGLVYHFSGSEAYSNTPTSNGYRDNQYIETINLQTQVHTAIINSNPPPSPDSSQAFGLPAPRPDWVLPAERRLATQNTEAFRQRGVDEYHGARDATWSESDNLFYISDEHGFFKVTTAGDSMFVGKPAAEGGNMKGISFVKSGTQTKLYAGSKDSANLYEINPADGQQIGTPLVVQAPFTVGGAVEPTGKILSLTQHPTTGVLYGITQPVGGDEAENRQLVTIDLSNVFIDPLFGPSVNATVIGTLATPGLDAAFSSIAFVGFTTTPPGVPGDYNNNGTVDAADYVLWRNGGPLQNEVADPGTISAGDYTEWRARFGRTSAGSGLGSAAAVPEPGTMLMTILGLAALTTFKRRPS